MEGGREREREIFLNILFFIFDLAFNCTQSLLDSVTIIFRAVIHELLAFPSQTQAKVISMD